MCKVFHCGFLHLQMKERQFQMGKGKEAAKTSRRPLLQNRSWGWNGALSPILILSVHLPLHLWLTVREKLELWLLLELWDLPPFKTGATEEIGPCTSIPVKRILIASSDWFSLGESARQHPGHQRLMITSPEQSP